jgi:hypothetical protein
VGRNATHDLMRIARVNNGAEMIKSGSSPAVGIGYRAALDDWTRKNLGCFNVLEITVDRCIHGGDGLRSKIFDLVGRIPLTARGIGLSIGTDVPLDDAYLDQVAPVPFVETYPPTNMGRLVSGRQFYEFLLAQWRREPPELAYLPDIAACELAIAEACNMAEDHEAPAKKSNGSEPRRGIRRHHRVVLLYCAYDIRSIFEAGLEEADPPKRDTWLALIQAGSDDLRVFEVLPVVFDLLAALDDWADPRMLGVVSGLETLVGELSARGLIEVQE